MTRRSHPHESSSLEEHVRAVAGQMQATLSTNLDEPYAEIGDYLAYLIGMGHDLLKDTEAFEGRLRGNRKNELSQHSGGSALLAYLVAAKILDQNSSLLQGVPFRHLIPHIVFNVIVAHHDKLKQTDLSRKHAKSIMHWQSTRSASSINIIKSMIERYEADYSIEQLDSDLNELRDNHFTLPVHDSHEITGEDFFCMFVLSKMCLGAIAHADAMSAGRQSNGIAEPDSFEENINQSRFEVEIPKNDSHNELNKLRTEFQNMVCLNWAPNLPVLLLKAPTGLGKTIAVSRLVKTIQDKFGPSKVFYMAPTTSILDQVSREIFSFNKSGSSMLLHYLAREMEDKDEGGYEPERIWENVKMFQRLDAGLVVTTYHRVLSSLGDVDKSSSIALFNLKRSIWIFDECQFLSHIQFSVFSLICSALQRLCGITPIFMSATPQSQFLWDNTHNALKWDNQPKLCSLLSEEELIALERSEYVDGRRIVHPCPDIVDIEALSAKVSEYRLNNPSQSILILLNLAKDAVKVSQLLEGVDYTITNFLRPKDVRAKLQKASGDLSQGKPILMVATSIVQAGVDLDFDVGFIELNDLRTFRQGCGRVGRNYELKRGCCKVFTFELKDRYLRPSWLRQRFNKVLDKTDYTDPVMDVYKNVVEKTVNKVLQSQLPLTDCQIEKIEAEHENEILSIIEVVKMRFLGPGIPGLPGPYQTLVNNESKQGVDFDLIQELLTDDLKDNDSASPYIVLITEADIDADGVTFFDRLMDLLQELEEKGKTIYPGQDDFFEQLKSYRILKQKIFQEIAPYTLRRKDIQTDFLKKHKKKKCYQELGFYLVQGSDSYDPNTIGWDVFKDAMIEDRGLIL